MATIVIAFCYNLYICNIGRRTDRNGEMWIKFAKADFYTILSAKFFCEASIFVESH